MVHVFFHPGRLEASLLPVAGSRFPCILLYVLIVHFWIVIYPMEIRSDLVRFLVALMWRYWDVRFGYFSVQSRDQ